MNKKTEKALHGSIKKWKEIVDEATNDRGRQNCPLCTLFYDLACRGCPVMDRTYLKYCAGSPYEAWDRYQYEAYIGGTDYEGFARTPEAKKLAMKELKFLKSLLPENNKEVT